jgi:hypothetical protein
VIATYLAGILAGAVNRGYDTAPIGFARWKQNRPNRDASGLGVDSSV